MGECQAFSVGQLHLEVLIGLDVGVAANRDGDGLRGFAIGKRNQARRQSPAEIIRIRRTAFYGEAQRTGALAAVAGDRVGIGRGASVAFILRNRQRRNRHRRISVGHAAIGEACPDRAPSRVKSAVADIGRIRTVEPELARDRVDREARCGAPLGLAVIGHQIEGRIALAHGFDLERRARRRVAVAQRHISARIETVGGGREADGEAAVLGHGDGRSISKRARRDVFAADVALLNHRKLVLVISAGGIGSNPVNRRFTILHHLERHIKRTILHHRIHRAAVAGIDECVAAQLWRARRQKAEPALGGIVDIAERHHKAFIVRRAIQIRDMNGEGVFFGGEGLVQTVIGDEPQAVVIRGGRREGKAHRVTQRQAKGPARIQLSHGGGAAVIKTALALALVERPQAGAEQFLAIGGFDLKHVASDIDGVVIDRHGRIVGKAVHPVDGDERVDGLHAPGAVGIAVIGYGHVQRRGVIGDRASVAPVKRHSGDNEAIIGRVINDARVVKRLRTSTRQAEKGIKILRAFQCAVLREPLQRPIDRIDQVVLARRAIRRRRRGQRVGDVSGFKANGPRAGVVGRPQIEAARVGQ